MLAFNIDKCHVLTLGKFENIQHTHRYTICHNKLEHVFVEKDLGVTFDSDLKVNKASAIAGLIRRSFSFLDGRLFKTLYTTFVRPHLEYAQTVWAPHLKKHIDMLERVQIRATKLVDGLGSMDYTERLNKLDLSTLVYRRARGDMTEVYKHLNIHDQDAIPKNFRLHNRGSRRYDHQLVWNMPKDDTRGIQANSFYYRTIKNWNELPRNVVNATTINSFKKQLDDAWEDKPFKYDPKQLSSS